MQNLKKSNPVYTFLKKGSKFVNSIVKDKTKLLLTLLSIILVFFIINRFKAVFFVALLVILGMISMLYVRFFNYAHYVGFEFCMMATVLTSLAYDPLLGAVVGFVSLSGAFMLSGYFKPRYATGVLILPLIGLIVPYFSELPLAYLGALMTFFYDIVLGPINVLLGSRIISNIIFAITHITINYWIFSTIAPVFLGAMI